MIKNFTLQPLLISSPRALRPETETQDKMLQTRPKTTPKVTMMIMMTTCFTWREIEMRMAKIKNLNFWKCLEISRIVATSKSRKLRLALYFFFFCTLYTFLNLVYLPGSCNFYFSQPFTNVHFSGLCTPFWECLDLSGIGGVRLWLTSCGRNEAPGEQPAHSEPFSSVF